MTARPFRKMHGLGNDFVVVDAREQPFAPSAAQAAAIADRRRGVGCDQLIVLEPAEPGDRADLFMRIFNADGSEAEACGNATRCVASLLFAEGREAVAIRTLGGLLPCTPAENGLVTADLGPARLDWREVPLAREMDTLRLDYAKGPLAEPVALSLGNPHVVFFVADPAAVALETLGPAIEHDPLFPRRTNVQIVQVVSRTHLRQRIWERGAGLTQASGSGGCAAQVAAVRRGLTERRARVEQPGGELIVEWREADGHVLMTGPVATAFCGMLDGSLLG
ncbi:diaminopimelate epimerase [Tistlia consotensis]|uniref:Diaminopimelate epimerase n=1 Tax=Tistlia consotensis USBA 355 TaxID=560819 RepID=A0A1Y6CME6_9PROT|nr:diaminopimelate epimerase [Tistlia consotensis]SMF74903.1 diaminopimelate epimerase [Tistlia consotensis USBA 355]SNS11362.1 diaminopimelate epimerase [Tistlia consotensis]